MKTIRTVTAFWRIPYGASTWRRFGYAVAEPPLVVVSLVSAGRVATMVEWQRRLARSLVGRPVSERSSRPVDRAAIMVSAVVMAVGLASWLLLWRFTYAVLAVPLTVNFVALALAGRAPAVGRWQRRLAGRLAAWPAGLRVVVHAVAVLAVGLVCLGLLWYLPLFALGSIAFPMVSLVGDAPAYGGPPLPWELWRMVRIPSGSGVWTSTFPTSNGGPTLAGAWAYHAVQFVVTMFPVIA